jgi:hypothetical protein
MKGSSRTALGTARLFEMLTGGTVVSLSTDSHDDEDGTQLFEMLEERCGTPGSGWVAMCATRPDCDRRLSLDDARPSGLVPAHAYTVVRAARTEQGARLVLLRNTWGDTEWQGAWSDGDTRWTAALRRQLDHANIDDGQFWMDVRDFVARFERVDFGKLLDNNLPPPVGQLDAEQLQPTASMPDTTHERADATAVAAQEKEQAGGVGVGGASRHGGGGGGGGGDGGGGERPHTVARSSVYAAAARVALDPLRLPCAAEASYVPFDFMSAWWGSADGGDNGQQGQLLYPPRAELWAQELASSTSLRPRRSRVTAGVSLRLSCVELLSDDDAVAASDATPIWAPIMQDASRCCYLEILATVSQNGYLLSRCGRSLPASAAIWTPTAPQ